MKSSYYRSGGGANFVKATNVDALIAIGTSQEPISFLDHLRVIFSQLIEYGRSIKEFQIRT